MAPRLSGQTSIFGVVFFVFESLWEKKLGKNCSFDPKPSEPCFDIDISNVAYSEARLVRFVNV